MILRGHKTVSQKMCPHKKYHKKCKKCPKKCRKISVPISVPNKCEKVPKKVFFVAKNMQKKTSVPNPGTVVVISMFSTKMIKLHLVLPRAETMSGARTVKLKGYPCNSQDSVTLLGQVC